MRNKIILLLLIVLSIAQVCYSQNNNEQQSKRCFEEMKLGTSEITFINEIKESIIRKQTYDAQCLHILIERGFYKAAILLFEEYFLTNNIDLHESTLRLTQNQKRDLDKFISTVMSANQPVQQIEPVLKWAQSQDHVFLYVKLSMRPDSPACVHCKVENIAFTNSTIFLSAFGIQSHQPLRFLFNLTLFDQINPDLSSWNQDSVGTLFFNLTKVHPNTSLNLDENNNVNGELLNDENNSNNNNNNEVIQESDNQDASENNKNNNDQDEKNNNQGEQQDNNSNQEQKDINSDEQPNSEVSQKPSTNSTASTPSTTTTASTTTTNSNNNENISNKIWLRLEKNERKKDIPIWWELRDRYQSDMDQWDKLCAKERENKKKKPASTNSTKKSTTTTTQTSSNNTQSTDKINTTDDNKSSTSTDINNNVEQPQQQDNTKTDL